MKDRPVGVALGWDMKPTLEFSDGKINLRKVENLMYSEYYPDGSIWPINPNTNKQMNIIVQSSKRGYK